MKFDFSDNSVLRREFKKGNERALVFLMDTYHHPLCLYVYSLSNDFDGAKDIVQNVLINLWERKSVLPDIKSFKSYLYKSVYNEFLNQYRKSGRVLIFEKEYFDTLNSLVNEENEDSINQQIKIVQKEIQKLPPKCRKTFLLSKQEGLTYIEIAQHMNVSIKTVENHMVKAFNILREKLGDNINQILFLLFNLKLNQTYLSNYNILNLKTYFKS